MSKRIPKVRQTSSGPAKSMLEQSLHAIMVPSDIPPHAVLASAVAFPCNHKHVGLIVTVDSSFLSSLDDPALRVMVSAGALSALPDSIKEAWGLTVLQAAMNSLNDDHELDELEGEIEKILRNLGFPRAH